MITQSSLHMAPMLIILPHTCTLYTGKQVLFKWTSGEGNCVTFGRLICVWGSLPLSIMTFGKRLWHICLNLEKSGLTAFSSSLFSSSAAWVSISNSGFSMITPFSTDNYNSMPFLFLPLPLSREGGRRLQVTSVHLHGQRCQSGQWYNPRMSWILIQSQSVLHTTCKCRFSSSRDKKRQISIILELPARSKGQSLNFHP